MKRGLWIIIAALLASLAGFVITHRPCCTFVEKPSSVFHGGSLLPELEWLRREFKLTDAQFTRVSELHLNYRPTCEMLCARVMASHDKIKKLIESGTQVTPEISTAFQEQAALHAECQTAMLQHLYQTAACLSPDQASRYLDTMLPQVIGMTMGSETTHSGH